MFMKKSLAVCSLVVLSAAGCVYADTNPAFNGVYIGVGVGYSAIQHEFKSDGMVKNATTGALITQVTSRFNTPQRAVNGDFDIGYQHTFNNWYGAVQLGYNMYSGTGQSNLENETLDNTTYYDVHAKLSNQYYLSFLLGRQINSNVVLALRLSALRAHLKYDVENQDMLIPGTLGGHNSGNVWGAGIGAEALVNLASHLNLTLMYNYSFYNTLAGDTYSDSANIRELNIHQTVTSSSFNAGLQYIF